MPSGTALGVLWQDDRVSEEVTAIVVTHNSARHLEALGRALVGGSLAPTRMLAVDNASVDDTVARARSAGFEVIERSRNDGFGAGCNAGWRTATTEFVLFCNPDVRPSSTALERLATTLMCTPGAAIAGAGLGEDVQARRFSSITTNFAGFLPKRLQGPVRRLAQNVPIDQSEVQVVVDYAEGAFVLCRVAALRSVNGFDERFFLYCEEEDLSRRLGERGWQTLLVPSATGHIKRARRARVSTQLTWRRFAPTASIGITGNITPGLMQSLLAA